MDSFRDALWLLRRTPVLETGLADALQEAVHAVTALPMDAPVAIDMALYDTALHAGTAGPADFSRLGTLAAWLACL